MSSKRTVPVKSSILDRKTFEMEGQYRNGICKGCRVGIVLKKDQRTGKITDGVVQDILTGSQFHPHGIKVRLTSGEVGRVKKIYE